MAFLDEIAAAVELGSTEAGSGTSFPIFKGTMPDSTVLGDRAVALVLSGGYADDARVTLDRPGLQVLVRGAPVNQVSTSYQEADSVAWSVKNALHSYYGTPESTGLYYVGIWNESGPFFIGYDEVQRPVFSNNLRIMRSRT